MAVAVAMPSAVDGQNVRSQLDRQIAGSRILATLASSGYTESHSVRYGMLRAGADTTISFNVSAGNSYRFVGFCDNDCSDIDLHLFEAGGREVQHDIDGDDEPVVTGERIADGTYRVKIDMASCSTPTCGWAVVTRRTSALPATGWRGQVSRQLSTNQAVASAAGDGFSPFASSEYGLLNRNTTTQVSYTLSAGRTYRFIGLCDDDCSDVDLRLTDAGGSEVASDMLSDAYPIITYTPRRTGTYRVVVSMASCSTTSCGWGLYPLNR